MPRVQPVKYKRPHAVNVVSVGLALLLAALGYVAYEFGRVYILRQQAYRVLEETGSNFAARRGAYTNEVRERDRLRERMENELREIGVRDPKAETWIEIEPDGAHFGVVYTAVYHWPFDVLTPIERDIEIEHTVP